MAHQFKVGQKVVCIDASFIKAHQRKYRRSILRKGAVYTVRAVTQCRCGHTFLDIGDHYRSKDMNCADCGCQIRGFGIALWHYACRFEPLVSIESEQAVEWAKKILAEPITV